MDFENDSDSENINFSEIVDTTRKKIPAWLFISEENDENSDFFLIKPWRSELNSQAIMFYKKKRESRLFTGEYPKSTLHVTIGFLGSDIDEDADDDDDNSVDILIEETYSGIQFIKFEYEGENYMVQEPVLFRKTPLSTKNIMNARENRVESEIVYISLCRIKGKFGGAFKKMNKD